VQLRATLPPRPPGQAEPRLVSHPGPARIPPMAHPGRAPLHQRPHRTPHLTPAWRPPRPATRRQPSAKERTAAKPPSDSAHPQSPPHPGTPAARRQDTPIARARPPAARALTASGGPARTPRRPPGRRSWRRDAPAPARPGPRSGPAATKTAHQPPWSRPRPPRPGPRPARGRRHDQLGPRSPARPVGPAVSGRFCGGGPAVARSIRAR
jgi:hypothetical protein